MKFLLIFLFSFFLSLRAKAASPLWYSDYTKTCTSQYLCAVGEGETLSEALGIARLEIAKYFQNKISSSSLISTNTEQVGNNPALAKFDEWSSKTTSEETNELINGLEVKRQEVVDGHHYVLVVLDRVKTATALKEKIDYFDSENNQLFKLNSRFTLLKIYKNLNEIRPLNERYTLLNNQPFKLSITKEILLERINGLSSVKMSLLSSNKKLPPKFSHMIIDLFSLLKITIVPKSESPKYYIKTEIITENQFFKVDGFVKLNIQFKLEILNTKNETIGKISTLSEQVARDNNQAIEKAGNEIRSSLQDNLVNFSNFKIDN